MSTLNLGETNIFTDLGKVIEGTLLTSNVGAGTTNMYSLALTKGVWICVFMYRCDQDSGDSFVGFNTTFVGTKASGSSATAISVQTITSDTATVYGTIYRASGSYTWTSGGRKCFAVKIA